MAERRSGPYTVEDLLAYWRGAVVDPTYARALVEQGDGSGLEVYTQQMAQLVRVSEAISRTGQSMFILPFSGQIDEPASGAVRATVELTITRTKNFDIPLTFGAGEVIAQEIGTDFGPVGALEVATGRRYVLAETVTLGPGEASATVLAIAEKAGYGYNNPLPGTLKEFVQIGAAFENFGASVLLTADSNRLQVTEQVDVVVPEHVGQYVVFTAGSNVGQVRRIVGYERPNPGVPHGGVAILARTSILRVNTVSGTFVQGEELIITDVGSGSGGGSAKYRHLTATAGAHFIMEGLQGAVAATDLITGASSNATAFVSTVDQTPDLAAEAGTAAWKVLDWEVDLGVTVTNTASPTGGKSPMLDELGSERNIPRASGEADDEYRQRVHTLPDVVSPNALKRAANEILEPLGFGVCLREVGDVDGLFPGMFYDVATPDPHTFYYYDIGDTPTEINQYGRFKLLMDFEEMRAFFMVGVPPLNLGEFGFGYDLGGLPAFDAFPFNAFYDGFPLTAAVIYRSIWQAIDKTRAGGVGFTLYQEARGCF